MKDDVTKITESRPIYRHGSWGEHVGWEYWVYFEPAGGTKTGHMIGTYERTGDFDTDYHALLQLEIDHEATCAECQEWRNGS